MSNFFSDLFSFYQELADKEAKEDRRKKKIDRIVRKAEAAQRFAKGMHFK